MAIKAYPVSVQSSPIPVRSAEGCPAPMAVPDKPNKASLFFNFLSRNFK